jgi:hypothetical protein
VSNLVVDVILESESVRTNHDGGVFAKKEIICWNTIRQIDWMGARVYDSFSVEFLHIFTTQMSHGRNQSDQMSSYSISPQLVFSSISSIWGVAARNKKETQIHFFDFKKLI